MSIVDRFNAYAATFEKAYESDDWSLLEPFFTEDAVYVIDSPPPFGARHEGREAVFAALKQSLDGFDRRFDARELSPLEGPVEKDGAVWMRWRVTYRVEDAPDCVMEGEETARFEGDRIRLLEDRFTEQTVQAVPAFLQEHGAKLR